jgi:peptidoglycan/LPS O-acetylase OafA/YrhL
MGAAGAAWFPSGEVARAAKDAPATRLVGIEGMRAVAAGSVLLYHVWLYSAPGGRSVDLGALTKVFDNLRAGVTLFFVLSGFLLFRPYVAAALRGTASPSLRQYLRNRALRILPAYWVILLVVALVFEHQLLRAPEQLVANAFLVHDYVASYIFGPGIVPAWSLAIEVVFYVCVPLLGAAAILLARRGRLSPVWAALVPVLFMVALGWGSKAAVHVFQLGRVWAVSFPVHADWFAGGMSLAVLRVLWEDGRLRLPRFWRLPALAVALIVGALAAHAYYAGQLSYIEYQTPIVVSCTIALALVVLAEPGSKLVYVLTRRPIVAAGLASYSVFLWHDPLLRFLRVHDLTWAGRQGFLLNVAVVAALTAVLSTLSYRLVEKPALSRKRSWQRGEPAGAPDQGAQPQHQELPSAAGAVAGVVNP